MNIQDIGYLLSNYWSQFLLGVASTLILSIVGTVGGLFLGIFLAFGERITLKKGEKWWRSWWKYLVKGLCHLYSVVIRGTPMMVQAMIFKYGCQALGLNWNKVAQGISVFDGWFYAGLIVITFNTAAYMGEIIKSGLNGVDRGQLEGAESLGLSSFESLFLITLPQALKNSLPTIGNEWVVNIKDSSVLNVIGVTELYFISNQVASSTFRSIASYCIIAIIYLILTLLTVGFLKLVEKKSNGEKFTFNFFHYRKKVA